MDFSYLIGIHHYLAIILDIVTILFFILVIINTKRLLGIDKEMKELKKQLEKVDSTFVSYLSMLDEENARLKKKLRKHTSKQKKS